MRRGSNNGITMTRGPIRVNRPIGGPPVGHNIGGRSRPAGDPDPPRRRADPSDERIDYADSPGPRTAVPGPSSSSGAPPRPSVRTAVRTALPPSLRARTDPGRRRRPGRPDRPTAAGAGTAGHRGPTPSGRRTTPPGLHTLLTSDDLSVDFTDFPFGGATRRDVTYYGAGCLADKVLAIELHSVPAGSTAPLRRPCAPRCDPIPDRTDTPRS